MINRLFVMRCSSVTFISVAERSKRNDRTNHSALPRNHAQISRCESVKRSTSSLKSPFSVAIEAELNCGQRSESRHSKPVDLTTRCSSLRGGNHRVDPHAIPLQMCKPKLFHQQEARISFRFQIHACGNLRAAR